MPKRPSAGRLVEKVAFDRRQIDNPDSPADYGNTETTWVEQFDCRAEFIHLRGGEEVMAARLANKHVQIIRVRSAVLTRGVEPDWRIRDENSGVFTTGGEWTGDVYNIRDITPSDDRQWIDFLCEKGVAA